MEKIVKEEIIDIKGTTKLIVGDSMYLDRIANNTDDGAEKELVFNGNISAAPLGKLRIRQLHIIEEGFEFDTIEVNVFQADKLSLLNVYLSDMYYPDTVKRDVELGCDTASFVIETKFGYDEFHTGADGYYGHMSQYKQHYGMRLDLSFDTDLFDFDDVKERMLALFPKRK